MMKYIFIFVESFGVAVLLFVLLGLTKAPLDLIIATSSEQSLVLQGLMVAAIAVSVVQSVRKIVWKSTSPLISRWFAITLVVLGGGVFFYTPDFFSHALQYPWSNYWFLVSYYSLPAIMVEGGLFGYFDYVMRHRHDLFISYRERNVVVVLIVLYLIIAVTMNFLTIERIVSIEHQVMFSRSIVVVALTLFTLLFVRKHY